MKDISYSLRAFLTLSVIGVILVLTVALIALAMINNREIALVLGLTAISSVAFGTGTMLLLRGHRTGLYVIFFTFLICSTGISTLCADILNQHLGILGAALPFVLSLIYLLALSLLLLTKKSGMRNIKQLDNSFDYKHFRHIYQLASLLIVLIVSVACWKMYMTNKSDDMLDGKMYSDIVTTKKLDSPNVSLDDILSFEQQYNDKNKSSERDIRITKRILALKHLLISGLMPQVHNTKDLRNICAIHRGEYSDDQQKILDWFLSLSPSEQDKWEQCKPAKTIEDFQNKLKLKISKK